MQRGQHDINDELIFTNHDGYIFHDSRGFEAGSKDELETIQEFVKRKSQEKRSAITRFKAFRGNSPEQ